VGEIGKQFKINTPRGDERRGNGLVFASNAGLGSLGTQILEEPARNWGTEGAWCLFRMCFPWSQRRKESARKGSVDLRRKLGMETSANHD